METSQKPAVSKRFYAALIALLLITNSVSLYFLLNTRTERATVTNEKMALERQFHNLSDTFTMRSQELELFKGRTAELDKAIEAKQADLDKSRQELTYLFAKNKLTQGELDRAQKLIAEYKTSIADMGAQIAELGKKNEVLLASNDKLNSDLNTERTTTGKLTEQNLGLVKKVEVGSLLPIAKLDVEAIRTKNNGKEVHVKRIKSTEGLRISFETGNNKVLDPGTVSLYVRIINPKGETIAVADQGSGTMTTVTNAEPMMFTKKADISYDQVNKKVVVYWTQNIKDAGTYKVELYQNGYVVGQGQVTLV